MGTAAHPAEAVRSPHVAVVIPTYNRAHLLPNSIASVLSQSYPNMSLIVSDNLSTDETPSVVEAFDDERLAYVRQPEHVDLNTHFSRCFEFAATSEYVFLIPDDDLLLPGALETAVGVLERHPNAGMVHGEAQVINGHGQLIHEAHNMTRTLAADTVEGGEAYIREAMRGGYRVYGSTVLFRTEAVRGLGYEQVDYPATDFALMLRLALNWDVAFVARPLAAYRVYDGTYTAGTGANANGLGYVQGLEMIASIRDVKLRFLARYGDRFSGVVEMRRDARRALREDIIVRAGCLSLPTRALRPAARGLAQGLRYDPRIGVDPAAWRLLAANAAGARARHAMRTVTRQREASARGGAARADRP